MTAHVLCMGSAKGGSGKTIITASIADFLHESRKHCLVIDCDAQAGSDRWSRLDMSKRFSGEVILVSEYDPLSATGIERPKHVVGEGLYHTRIWFRFNKLLPEFDEKFGDFLSIARFLPPILWNADVEGVVAVHRAFGAEAEGT